MKYWLFLIVIILASIPAFAQEETLSYKDAKVKCDSVRDHNFKLRRFPAVRSNCVVGATIPEFTVQTMDGQSISSSDLKGKVTIINFWFMFCTPCVAELPGLNAIVETYGDQLNYIAINGSDDPELIPEFLENNPFHFTHIADGGDFARDVFGMTWGYPTTFILNKEGVIVKAITGGKADEGAIEQIQEKIVPLVEKLLNE